MKGQSTLVLFASVLLTVNVNKCKVATLLPYIREGSEKKLLTHLLKHQQNSIINIKPHHHHHHHDNNSNNNQERLM